MSDMTNDFGEYILQELGKRGWSMRELARRAGLSATSISYVIKGRAGPGLDLCKGIAHAFKVPPEVVLYRAGLLNQPPDFDPTLSEIISLFNYLPEEAREQALAWLRFMVQHYSKKVATNPK